MNDKDKNAFEKWFKHFFWSVSSTKHDCFSGWEAACEYKQKEINELEKEKDYLCKKMENMRDIYKHSERLQAENAKWKNAYEEEAQDHAKTAINLQKLISELEAENAKLNQEIEKFKGYLEAWGSNE